MMRGTLKVLRVTLIGEGGARDGMEKGRRLLREEDIGEERRGGKMKRCVDNSCGIRSGRAAASARGHH